VRQIRPPGCGEQGFEAAADEAELVVELAVGVFEGVHRS
jgi:hypothetical protein